MSSASPPFINSDTPSSVLGDKNDSVFSMLETVSGHIKKTTNMSWEKCVLISKDPKVPSNNILPYVNMLFIQLLTLHSQKRSNKVHNHKYICTQCTFKGWKIAWGEHRNGNSWREQACSCSVWHVTLWLNSSAPLLLFPLFSQVPVAGCFRQKSEH